MSKRAFMSTAAVLLLIAAPTQASDDGGITFAREVDSCISEINNRADYNDATRVRHTVVEVKNTFSGYVLSISTDVFTDSASVAAREYATWCVAKGDAKPKKFTIDRISG